MKEKRGEIREHFVNDKTISEDVLRILQGRSHLQPTVIFRVG